MRVAALDFGLRRIGVAVSDVTRTLARPLAVVPAGQPDTLDRVVELIDELAGEEGGLETIVVGCPTRLDGSPHAMTASVQAFVEALRERVSLPIVLQDERLSSHEAEERLSVRHRTWQERKLRLDAASAAVILQDFLDERASRTSSTPRTP